MHIQLADESHVKDLAVLFDQYRVFYGQESDLEAATEFLKERIEHQESVVLLALDDEAQVAGFTQLYPSYSSVSMKPIWILNDLFISEDHRRKGLASSLLREAATFAKQDGAVRLVLQTEVTNASAISLYEKESWVKDSEHHYFEFEIK